MASKINTIAIPAIIAGLSEPIVSLTDNFFISNISDAAVTAVGVASSFFMLLVWVFGSLRGAISAEVAHFFGIKDQDSVRKLSFQALALVLAFGVLLAIFSFIFSEQILKVYELEGEAFIQAKTYLSVRLLGLPLVLSTVALSAIFRGVHQTNWIMYAVIIGALSNIILDYFLISESALLPAYGVTGAAWASFVSQSVIFVLLFIQYIKNIGWVKDLDFSRWKALSRHSINLFIRALSMNVIFFFLNRWAVDAGVEVGAVHVVFINIWLFTTYFIDGYSDAAMVMAGSLMAQSRMEEVVRLLKKVTFINILIGLGLILGIAMLSGFLSEALLYSQEAKALFTDQIFLLLIAIPIGGICFSWDGILIGTKQTVFLRNYMVVSVTAVLLTYFLSTNLGLTGIAPVWLSVIAWLLYRALAPFLFLNKILKA